MDNRVKVFFQLEPDEDGWPPVGAESVWAEPGTSENEYVIANVPFFARGATVDDTVQVRMEDGCLWFEKRIQSSKNSLIRIIVSDVDKLEDVSNYLVALGCDTELAPEFKLVAINIPENVKLSDVQEYLQKESEAGKLDYEEPILRQDL